LLPSFLAERSSPARARNTSKTREIVDRLRSSHRSRRADTSSRRPSTATRPDQGLNGEASAADAQASSEMIDGWINSVVNDERAAESLISDDGWIESSPTKLLLQRRSSSHTPPSSASTAVFPSPSPSATSFGMPCTPQQPTFYSPPFPPPNAAMMQAAYMQMQMQIQQAQAQAQAQARWQVQLNSAATGFSAPAGFFPPYAYGVTPAFPPAHAFGGISSPTGPVLYEAKGQMGNTGVHVL